MEKISCIYTITNTLSNKIYLGYSSNFKRRKDKHLTMLRGGYHANSHLQNDVNKHGIDKFLIEILVDCQSTLLASEEHYWATLLNVHDRNYGYNILPTHPKKLNSGHLEETLLKISKANKGKIHTKEFAELCRSRFKGIKRKQDSIDKTINTKRKNGILKQSESTINKIKNTKLKSCSKVLQYDIDGNFIKEWKNTLDILENSNFKLQAIYKCLNGDNKSSQNFIWKYEKNN